MEISLKSMTKELCRAFYKDFVLDLSLFVDPEQYKPYIYSEETCDAYYERYRNMGRVHMAVMLQDKPIGEIVLKNIDRNRKWCTMGITMANDSYKDKGYGTTAERMALQYAFNELGMETVYADSLRENLRSQHVLKKVGFAETRQDDTFIYYECRKASWKP